MKNKKKSQKQRNKNRMEHSAASGKNGAGRPGDSGPAQSDSTSSPNGAAAALRPVTIVSGLGGTEWTFHVDPTRIRKMKDLAPFLIASEEFRTVFHPDKSKPLPPGSRIRWLRNGSPYQCASTAGASLRQGATTGAAVAKVMEIGAQQELTGHRSTCGQEREVVVKKNHLCDRDATLLGEIQSKHAVSTRHPGLEHAVAQADLYEPPQEDLVEDPEEEILFDGVTKYRYVFQTPPNPVELNPDGLPRNTDSYVDAMEWIFEQAYLGYDCKPGDDRKTRERNPVRTVLPLDRRTLTWNSWVWLMTSPHIVREVIRLTDEEWAFYGWMDQHLPEDAREEETEKEIQVAQKTIGDKPGKVQKTGATTKVEEDANSDKEKHAVPSSTMKTTTTDEEVTRSCGLSAPTSSRMKTFRQAYLERVLAPFLFHDVDDGTTFFGTDKKRLFLFSHIITPALKQIADWSIVDFDALFYFLRFDDPMNVADGLQADLDNPFVLAPFGCFFECIGDNQRAWRCIADVLKKKLVEFLSEKRPEQEMRIELTPGRESVEGVHLFQEKCKELLRGCIPIVTLFTDKMTAVGFPEYTAEVVQVINTFHKRTQDLVKHATNWLLCLEDFRPAVDQQSPTALPGTSDEEEKSGGAADDESEDVSSGSADVDESEGEAENSGFSTDPLERKVAALMKMNW
ncbi:unnamed protein product [Amoebophrya sp. A120]|nr:unnamed protein product [Amoebophrya sp. A120]|eukprot:GSA120T00017616001.1